MFSVIFFQENYLFLHVLFADMAAIPERMRRSRKHLIKPAQSDMSDARALELETAKQILAEVFHARPSDVEDMIMRRLEERSRLEESNSLGVGSSLEEGGRFTEKSCFKENRIFGKWGTWPEMFQVEGEMKL